MMAAPNSPDAEEYDGTDPSAPSAATGTPKQIARLPFLLARLVLLAGIVGLAGLVAWDWNGKKHGAVGAELAIFSMVGCGCSAGLALLIVGLTAGGKRAYAGLLVSILFRTLGPMALGVVWRLMHPEWSIRNLTEVHVSLFLVSLTVETILVVDIVSNFSSSSANSSGKDRITRKPHG
jgi:hypothetical protein